LKGDLREQELLKGLAAHDRSAAETIYQENYGMIKSLIINNNGSPDEVQDIFQEAMLVLYEKVRSGEFELHCQIKTFLYSVCKRLWLKQLQKKYPYSPDISTVEETVPVEEEMENHQEIEQEFRMMEKAISSLGEPCRTLIEAFYLRRKTMQEISAEFGYTNADNAKNQKYKCLMRLKKIFFSQAKNGNGDE